MPVFAEKASSGRPVCPDCGDVIGGYPYGAPYKCGEHTSIVEYPTDDQCDQCGEPFLPANGLTNMSKTYTIYRPATPSCHCPIKEN